MQQNQTFVPQGLRNSRTQIKTIRKVKAVSKTRILNKKCTENYKVKKQLVSTIQGDYCRIVTERVKFHGPT